MANARAGKKRRAGKFSMKIQANNLVRRFKSYIALDDVSLSVEEGELLALLGPSGSGKTTLLRVIAGLDYPDSGGILFDDQDATRLPIRKRRVGFVFQHYALFRHMNVFKNIAFGLEVLPRRFRLKPAEVRARVSELLRLVQLGGFENRLPSELSGGQRQRVALARALAIEPRILLPEPASITYSLKSKFSEICDRCELESS